MHATVTCFSSTPAATARGPVDIDVNEPLPATEASSLTPLGDEFPLRTEAP